MRLKYLIELLPKGCDIRIGKTGYSLLYNGEITFTPKNLMNQKAISLFYVYYTLTKYKKKRYLGRPYYMIFLESDREPKPSTQEIIKPRTNYIPPSQQDAKKIAEEFDIDYFDEIDDMFKE